MLAEGYGLPVTLLPVAQPGLCAVRNAIAAAALDDPAMRFVAMIDDDEWPQPGWLDALLICQAQVGADVVAGPVDSRFVGPPPRWGREPLVFRAEERPWGATGPRRARQTLAGIRRGLPFIGTPLD